VRFPPQPYNTSFTRAQAKHPAGQLGQLRLERSRKSQSAAFGLSVCIGLDRRSSFAASERLEHLQAGRQVPPYLQRDGKFDQRDPCWSAAAGDAFARRRRLLDDLGKFRSFNFYYAPNAAARSHPQLHLFQNSDPSHDEKTRAAASTTEEGVRPILD
jgi:hypothetical protein